MKKISPFAAIVAAFAFAVALPSEGQAQNRRTFIAVPGTDTGICPDTAPCASFDYAISQTYPGGVVTCLTSGRFLSISVNKSVTVNCLGTNATPGGNVVVNTTAATDKVILRGLEIQASSFADSISFTGAGTLILDQVKVGAGTSSDGATALRFQPNGAGKLVISDSIFTTGGTSTGGGIVVKPQPGGTAQVALTRVVIAGNAFGFAVDGSGSTGGINATITDSMMASNTNDGLVATSSPSTAPLGVTIVNSSLLNNGFGVRSIGSNVTVRVEGSKIIGNGTGLSGGGALITGGGNTIQGNGNNGGFTGSYALQ